ncbi:efflux RND transporter periplasmic adaptor subunit [Mitsuaria sp. GD03876]|uniref:efflux RND transporter periplasmic adaptor subunit n=1 Tax=Mitsuaria sp. GD03876 TaxID=2975399 RepID=UPI0024494D24|nr:efflux RND transporter periplasmic adaptor subunit [Mitsuaria sp. GD03876]MDH0865391.1 efflux RND transporter periplasmic adaptor subunit [Mitsuaria sp. GD03876]
MADTVRTSPRPLARRAVPVALTAVALAAVMGPLYAWRAHRQAAPPPPPPGPTQVATTRVTMRDAGADIQAIGSLEAVREVLVAPDTAGRVTAIAFEPGQSVPAGAVLLQLYDAPERADRVAAEAKAAFAEQHLARTRQLVPSGAESRETLELRQSEADQARAAVRQLDARIEQKTVRAPFAGQLGLRRVNPGQYLNAGQAIATLTQLDPLHVNFTVPQQRLAELAVGRPVQVAVDGLPGRTFVAKVSAIEPRVEGTTRNVTVQALLPNPDRSLKSGMYATVRVPSAASTAAPAATQAAVVPLTAVVTTASGDTVVRVRDVDAQGVGGIEVVPVQVLRTVGDEALLKDGLAAGDLVIVAGQNRLRPGAKVRTGPARSPDAAPPAPSRPAASSGPAASSPMASGAPSAPSR